MNWKVSGETTPRGYAFTYDGLSRLTRANYLINGVVQAYNASTPSNPIYQTIYSYDKHGNMKTMQRYGKTTSGSTYNLVDNLTMTYSGNQLTNVADAIANFAYPESADFKDAEGTGIEYTGWRGFVNRALRTDKNSSCQFAFLHFWQDGLSIPWAGSRWQLSASKAFFQKLKNSVSFVRF